MRNGKTSNLNKRGPKLMSVEDRFWSKVSFGLGPDACWTWKNSIDEKGYGQFNFGGKRVRAHRVSWMLSIGEIPEHDSYHGMCVCHKCDNSSCVNPSHLFLGTVQENNYDMQEKGRYYSPKGEKSPNAKLNENEVLLIRHMYSSDNFTMWKLSKIFGVDDTTICDIVNRKAWTHI